MGGVDSDGIRTLPSSFLGFMRLKFEISGLVDRKEQINLLRIFEAKANENLL